MSRCVWVMIQQLFSQVIQTDKGFIPAVLKPVDVFDDDLHMPIIKCPFGVPNQPLLSGIITK